MITRNKTITELWRSVSMQQESLLPPKKPLQKESTELARISAIALSIDLGVHRSGTAYVLRTQKGIGPMIAARQSLYGLESFILKLKDQWREGNE